MDGIDNVLVSGGVAALIAIALYLAPLRPTGKGQNGPNALARLQNLESRYAELQSQYSALNGDFQAKLVEYTEAYGIWLRRESDYQDRIHRLENEINRLRKRIIELEALAGVQVEIDVENTELTVIGIWPDSGLDIDGEVDALYDAGYNYRRIEGAQATRSGIIRELRRHGIDHKLIVEIGAHGSAEGVMLHNGDLVSPGWWRRVLADHNIALAVLMFCKSDTVGDALMDSGVSAVVSLQSEIADEHAVLFVRELYQRLSAGYGIQAAAEYARLHLPNAAMEAIRVRVA